MYSQWLIDKLFDDHNNYNIKLNKIVIYSIKFSGSLYTKLFGS